MRILSPRMAVFLLSAVAALNSGGCLSEFPSRGDPDPEPLPPPVSDAEVPPVDAPPSPDADNPPDAAPSDAALSDAALADAAPAIVLSLRVAPDPVAVRYDQTLDLRAVAALSDGTERDLTTQATWTFADPEVASISDDPAGRLSPLAVGETTLIATVGDLVSAPTTGRITPLAGTPPVAQLTCPQTGERGETLRFDGSTSTYPDGPIMAWLFDFGDDSEPSGDGSQAVVEHAFAAPGRYEVRLTVVDGSAASASTSCAVEVGGELPLVRLIEPADGQAVSPGETLTAVIDAQAGDGRQLVEVAAILDGAWAGAVEAEPYRIEIEIPADASPGATLAIVAQGRDARGGVGTSAAVLVVVRVE